jgi:hypothetical protein
MGAHGRPVDEAEALVWTESIRLRALTLADQVQPMVQECLTGDEFAWQGWVAKARDLLREVANA